MRHIGVPLLVIVIAVVLIACDRQSLHRYQSFAFGTLVEIKIRLDDKTVADQASADLFSDFDKMHREWHAWEPGKLTQTNAQLSRPEWFTVDNSILDLIKTACRYSLLSNSLFNPAIGRLIKVWGFQGSEQPESPPSWEEVDILMQNLPTVQNIELDGDKMRSNNSQVKLDLGAIAKGYAVAAGIEKLRMQGIQNALINAGGDLCGIGNQGRRPWRIGIRSPSTEGVMASIELHDNECVFTSGDYERYFTHDGKRYHHILDPRTGYPAKKAVSVTVLHEDGSLADAASTALFIAGPDEWPEIADRMGISDVMMMDRQGRIHMTPSMQKRLKLEQEFSTLPVIINTPNPAEPSLN